MHSVELDRLLLDLYGQVDLVVRVRHGLELADRVGGEAPPLGAVVQHKSSVGFVVDKVGRRPQPGCGCLMISFSFSAPTDAGI